MLKVLSRSGLFVGMFCLLWGLSGCASSPGEQRHLIGRLMASENVDDEYRAAKSIRRKLPVYGISIQSLTTHQEILLNDLYKHMNEKLQVTIYHRHRNFTWTPRDNDNILLLLRE